MDADRWHRLQELFVLAREGDAVARERLIDDTARADEELARELQSLLEADARPGMMDAVAPALSPVSAVWGAPPPQRVGAYRIVSELGRGGMGTVYLGERDDGQFEQRVAIKLIATTDSNDPMHQRFLVERRILSALEHPNIARLLDGGVLEDGRPYLTMEYIDGLPITDWCDQHRLGLEGRMRLFAEVCDAVQHAHQNLIIHRDLKPTNILVARDGHPRLLDFGIAKLLDSAHAMAREPLTRHGMLPMTPEYASPEQVRGEALTTSSDIYALGVLLHVLLTGRSPYRLTNNSLVELAGAVAHQDPELPSERAARGDIEAAPRGASAERLARQLEGDLDGIVLMALRKEPGRRYASADVLRQDVERHLSGLPVLAHAGSSRYRIGKFVRRHRVEAGATAVLVGGLVVALTLVLGESRRANRERARAEQALAQSEGVSNFMTELFQGGDENDTVGTASLSAADLVQRGAARANTLSGQPVVQGRLLDVLGRMSLSMGRLADAQRLFEQAVAVRRGGAGGGPLALAQSLIGLAQTHRTRGNLDSARTLADEALRLRAGALPERHPDIADALYELGWLHAGPMQERLYRQALAILPDTGAHAEQRVALFKALSTNLRRQGRLSDAVAADREAVRIAESSFGAEHHVTGAAMIHLADQLRDIEGDIDGAERLYRRALAMLEARYGTQSVRLLHGLNSLGALLSERGNAEAERVMRRALALRQSASGPEHPDVASRQEALARELARQGRLEEAETLQRQALALSIRVLGAAHPAVTSARMPRLAEILALRGRYGDADSTYETALKVLTTVRVTEGETRRDYGRLLLRRGHYERAERELLRALAALETHYAGQAHPNVIESKRALMELYSRWGRPAQLEQYRVPAGRYVAY